jgi:tetratricopeptide (TPR) repeat protein
MRFATGIAHGLVLYAAICTLPAIAAPETPADLEHRITKLIGELGDRDYAVRERAQRELARLGLEAFDALAAAKNSDDIEVAAQARYLVRQIRFEWGRDTDPPAVQELLKDYEGQPPNARSAKISQLAEMTDLASLEWLCRLARFEESQVLSKEAALKAMGRSVPVDTEASKEHFATIERTVAGGKRPAAQWLRTFLVEQKQPDVAVVEWDKLITAEEKLLDKPTETTPRLVSDLLRRQVGQLDRLKRPDDSLKVIARLVQLEQGETASLAALVDWLRERQAWTIINDVATRFADTFNSDATLLYTLAQARLAQGNVEVAEQTAKKAFELIPDKLEEHFALADLLQKRGLHDWSDREYRFIIEKLPPVNRGTVVARLVLSEDLHDRQREAEAADVLKPMVDAVDRNDREMKQMLDSMDRPIGSLKSRMLYFAACAAGQKGDVAKQTELLDKGIIADPNDADVLIGLYRLPNQDEARRKRVKDLIEKSVQFTRAQIDESPEDPTAYNQLAWLIANTYGDFDEAIQLSHKSIELKRAGGYLDTLGHCYYAKGDYENAVKYQTEAAKMDSHSQAIVRQLKVFRKALEDQQAAAKK